MPKKEVVAKQETLAAVQHRTRCLIIERLEPRAMLHGEQFEFLIFGYQRAAVQDFVDLAKPPEFHGESRPGQRTGQQAEGELHAPGQPPFEPARENAFVPTLNSMIPIKFVVTPPVPPRAFDSVIISINIERSSSSSQSLLSGANKLVANDITAQNNLAVNAAAVDRVLTADRSATIGRNQSIASPTVASATLRAVESKSDNTILPGSAPVVSDNARRIASEHGIGSRTIGLDGMLSLRSSDANQRTPRQTNDDDALKGLPAIGNKDAIDATMAQGMGDEFDLLESPKSGKVSDLKYSALGKNNVIFDHLRLNRSSNEIAPWPEGMLSIGLEESSPNSAPAALASMDPLAVVQMFIRAGELSGAVVSPSSHSEANESSIVEPAAWLRWLRDPRVSAVVSVTLGMIAVATSRQSKSHPNVRSNGSKNRFCR